MFGEIYFAHIISIEGHFANLKHIYCCPL